MISAAAAFKGKARKTVKLEAAALPEAAAVKGGSGYEAHEFAKYEGDSKGKIHLLCVQGDRGGRGPWLGWLSSPSWWAATVVTYFQNKRAMAL